MLYSGQAGAEENVNAGSGAGGSQQSVEQSLLFKMRLPLRRKESEFAWGRGLHTGTHRKIPRLLVGTPRFERCFYAFHV